MLLPTHLGRGRGLRCRSVCPECRCCEGTVVRKSAPPAHPLPTLQGLLPDSPTLMQRLSVRDHGVPVVAGTADGWHTLAHVVQESALRAGAAIHRHEADATGEVLVAPGPAGGLAGADVVLVGHRLGTGVHGLCCGMPGRGQYSGHTGRPQAPGSMSCQARPPQQNLGPCWLGCSLVSEPGAGRGPWSMYSSCWGHPALPTHCRRRPSSR